MPLNQYRIEQKITEVEEMYYNLKFTLKERLCFTFGHASQYLIYMEKMACNTTYYGIKEELHMVFQSFRVLKVKVV